MAAVGAGADRPWVLPPARWSVALWRRRITAATATVTTLATTAMRHRIPITDRRPAYGAMCGTATLGFAPACDLCMRCCERSQTDAAKGCRWCPGGERRKLFV